MGEFERVSDILETLRTYLRQCTCDYEDRWITREILHKKLHDYDNDYIHSDI